MKNTNLERYLYNLSNSNSKDSGSVSKGFESIARAYVLRGRVRPEDIKPRGRHEMDCTFYFNGKLVKLEMKCGCGAVRYFTSDGMGGWLDEVAPEDFTDDMVLAGCDYVVFMLESDPRILSNPELVLRGAYVLPRAQFAEMLHACSKTGKLHVKFDKSRGQVTMQNLFSRNAKTGKISDRPLQRAYEFLDNCEAESFGEFLERFGRV